MILKQNEIDVITELQTQEKNCVEKYRRYKEQAKDEELKICLVRSSSSNKNITIHWGRY